MSEPTPPGEEGMRLAPAEERALALHLAADHIEGVDRWLDWGDVPMLGEFVFERLADAVQRVAVDLRYQASEAVGDLPALIERATRSGAQEATDG